MTACAAALCVLLFGSTPTSEAVREHDVEEIDQFWKDSMRGFCQESGRVMYYGSDYTSAGDKCVTQEEWQQIIKESLQGYPPGAGIMP